MSSGVRWWRVTSSYGVTLFVTVVATLLWRASGRSWDGTRGALGLNAIMLVPGAVTLALSRFVFRAPLREAFALRRPSLRWLITASLLASALMLAALLVGSLFPRVIFSNELAGLEMLGMSPAETSAMRARLPNNPSGAVVALVIQGLVAGPTLCLLGAMGEELAWRGFFHAELAPLGFWRRSTLLGLLWGAWHLPLVLQGYAYPHHPWLGSGLILGLTQVLAPIYARLRDRSSSVLVPAIFHGTCSASGIVAAAFLGGGSELSTSFTGAAGLLASSVVGSVFLWVTRTRR